MKGMVTTWRSRVVSALQQRPAKLLGALGAGAGIALLSVGAAYAYFTATASNPAAALASTLTAPTGGTQNGTATPVSIAIKWTAPSGYSPTGFTVLRCTGKSCTPTSVITTGGCSGTISGTSCADTDPSLTAGTTYSYAVQAHLDNWMSPPDAFQASTTPDTKLTFTVQPSSGQNIPAAGTGSAFPVSVAVQDSSGVTDTNDSTDSVTIAIDHDPPGNGVLSCTGGLTATAAGGVATFTGCTIPQAGTGYTLRAASATSPGLTPPATANSFNVVPGPAAKLVFTTTPVSGTTSSTANRGPITVQEQDSAGNPVLAGTGGTPVNLSASPATGAVFAASKNGTATASVTIPANSSAVTFWFGDTHAGSPVITAASTGLTSAMQTEQVSKNFSATSLGNAVATCSGTTTVTCLGPTVSTAAGRAEVIFIYTESTGNTSPASQVTSVTGPFSGTSSNYASTSYTKVEAGMRADNYLFGWQATGSGGAASQVTVKFTNLDASKATVWIDVVELGSGDSPVACAGCTDKGGSGSSGATATVQTGGSTSDSELAFLGTADTTYFSPPPAGWTTLAGGGTGIQYGTYASPDLSSPASFTMNSAGKGWGSIAVDVSP
jgi:hypothetical protein